MPAVLPLPREVEETAPVAQLQTETQPGHLAGTREQVSRPTPTALRRSRRRGRGRLYAGLSALLILLLIGTSAGVGAWLAQRRAAALQGEVANEFRAAQAELDAGKALLKVASSTHDMAKIQEAKTHFLIARDTFARTRKQVDDDSLVKQAAAMPLTAGYVNTRRDAVDKLADMGVALTYAAVDTADISGLLINPDAGSGQGAARLLSVLKQAQPGVTKVHDDLERARLAVGAVHVDVLPAAQKASVDAAKTSIATGLASIDEFNRLIPVLGEILGANGQRYDLVEQLDPAELRPAGGFLGTYSLLSANNGELKVTQGGNSFFNQAQRPPRGQNGYVAPPAALRDLISNDSWSFPDSNFAPDFPANGEAGEKFIDDRLGVKTDGVIAIDMFAVAAVLAVTGPISMPAYSFTFDSSNFVPEVVKRTIAGDATHKQLLSDISVPLIEKVANLPSNRWPELVTALNTMAADHHIQAYFHNGPAETEMKNIGWSGTLNPAAQADYMYENEANLGGTKANYFLYRNYSVVLTRNGSTLHHQVTISYEDDSNKPNTNYYSCYVRLYVPESATNLQSKNLRNPNYPNPEIPKGLKMIDGWFALHVDPKTSKGSTQIEFSYDTPWKPDAAGNAQVYWQKQAGPVQDKVDVKWIVDGQTFTAASDLIQDRVIRLKPNGVSVEAGLAGSAHLPGLSL